MMVELNTIRRSLCYKSDKFDNIETSPPRHSLSQQTVRGDLKLMEKRNPLICWHGSGNVEQCRRKKGAEYII